jgi:hypothetical protein
MMSMLEFPIAMPVWSTGAGSSGFGRAKAVSLEAFQILSEMAGEALFAYATTGSAISGLATIAAPHLGTLVRSALEFREE